ncbi:MAG: hypothetical protein IJP34_04530 [Clostridia bacterium]|nr:hypothetical protein [Clostridia bacterium]
MNFRYKLMQFMAGRYGPDKLSYFLVVCSLIISFLNILLRFIAISVSSPVLLILGYVFQLLGYGILGYAFFRVLSRNIYARQKENAWFLNKTSFIKRRRDFINQKKADKSHIYRKCPKCKAVLRLPHRIGTHKTVCPRCSKEFTVRVKK